MRKPRKVGFALPYERGDRVWVLDRGKWYPGTVVGWQIKGHFDDEGYLGYKVRIDGWSHRRYPGPKNMRMLEPRKAVPA